MVINNIKRNSNSFLIFFNSLDAEYAWLEDNNKHQCNVVECKINKSERFVEIDFGSIHNFLLDSIVLRLVLSNEFDKCKYNILDIDLLKEFNESIEFPFVQFQINKNNELILTKKEVCNGNDIKVTQNEPLVLDNKDSQLKKSSLQQCPLKVLIIGSCFSRSMFKSDEYFNPDYKKYFNVCYTSFHNSIISIMSKSIDDCTYKKFNDLYYEGIKDYVDMEFNKNLFDIIDNLNPNYLVIDNYADATLPIVKIKNDSYFTYNKYFSESIYKRKFAKCDVILPNSVNHMKLYSQYLDLFKKEIYKRHLQNKIILIGGRLSMKKIHSNSIDLWPQREWIIPSNNYWDEIDKLFLQILQKTTYIDFRETEWVSDTNNPLIGGATPSHYQSGYYKEMFKKLKTSIFI